MQNTPGCGYSRLDDAAQAQVCVVHQRRAIGVAVGTDAAQGIVVAEVVDVADKPPVGISDRDGPDRVGRAVGVAVLDVQRGSGVHEPAMLLVFELKLAEGVEQRETWLTGCVVPVSE